METHRTKFYQAAESPGREAEPWTPAPSENATVHLGRTRTNMKEKTDAAPLSVERASGLWLDLKGTSVSSTLQTAAKQRRRRRPATRRLYLSSSLGESTGSSSSSLSSFAPISRWRAKSSKMMSSSLRREGGGGLIHDKDG